MGVLDYSDLDKKKKSTSNLWSKINTDLIPFLPCSQKTSLIEAVPKKCRHCKDRFARHKFDLISGGFYEKLTTVKMFKFLNELSIS